MEMHSEYGFIAMRGDKVSLTTVMSNGFTTVEEGGVDGESIKLKLIDIGRISFGHDVQVNNVSVNTCIH
jgi:hypothetical protein